MSTLLIYCTSNLTHLLYLEPYSFIVPRTLLIYCTSNLTHLLEHKKGATYKFENQLKPLELAFHFTGRYCLF
jgi:hypothetical protein